MHTHHEPELIHPRGFGPFGGPCFPLPGDIRRPDPFLQQPTFPPPTFPPNYPRPITGRPPWIPVYGEPQPTVPGLHYPIYQ
jgi:hypothetical protein